jgi:hypothetical protein
MGPSFLVITLTPPLSREPGEGVTWSRPDKGLFGGESTEVTEERVKNLKPKSRAKDERQKQERSFSIFVHGF